MNAVVKNTPGADYSIGRDPQLSLQVRQEFVDTLVARTDIDVEKATQELAARDVQAAFDKQFANLALSREYLPDVLAAHVIAMWSIVHDGEFPNADVAAAISKQLGSSLRGRPEAVDAARRQLIGEALIYECMLSLEARDQARAAGDRTQLKTMAETAQRNMLNRQAINLKKTRLTTSGLQRV